MRCWTGGRRARGRVGILLGTIALVGAPLGCSDVGERTGDRPSDDSPPAAGGARLDLPGRPLVLLAPRSRQTAHPVQVGGVQLDVSVASVADGRLSVDSAGPLHAAAFDFPAFRATGPYPRAVLVARDPGSDDRLSPGTADFAYGADLRLDDVSEGRVEDNGDNVVQRGLATDAVMFKLEVDERRPGCTVKGADGALSVFHPELVEPGRWYRVRCERASEGITIYVAELPLRGETSGPGRTKRGPTGEVTMSEPGVPLSVGGKVASDGTVVASASDQFNGSIANPFLLVRSDQ